MTKVGVLLRADGRGLSIQSEELYRAISSSHPDTYGLLIDAAHKSPYPVDASRFPGIPVVSWSGEYLEPAPILLSFLDSIDVLLSCETFYQDDIPEYLRAYGKRSVLQANWEFMRWLNDPELSRPDIFIAPSLWNIDRWPKGTAHLPPPVARDRLPFTHRTTPARNFLHVIGHAAAMDRAGTRIVLEALHYINTPINLTIRTQTPWIDLPHHWEQGNVTVTVVEENTPNYWDIYAGHDVLLAPRRYGGLSLPIAEAASLGMPIIALDREPENLILPRDCLVTSRVSARVTFYGGEIHAYTCHPVSLAKKMNELAHDDGLMSVLSAASDKYAQTLEWQTLWPKYREVLGL